MKHVLMLLFFCLPASLNARQIMYVAAKSGLTLRDNNSTDGNSITRIPYGEIVTVDSQTNTITIDGFTTNWAWVNYKGQSGYVVYAYLLPIPPPKNGTKDFENYATQLSESACKPVIISDSSVYEDVNVEYVGSLYKNGVIYNRHNDYEFFSESIIIPAISIKQAFVIAQNLSQTSGILPPDGKFPTENSSSKGTDGHYRQVQMHYYESVDSSYKLLENITFVVDEYDVDGMVTIARVGGYVIISYEWGS